MLKLNVGLSRKVGEANYGSRGASVNLELEVESALAGDPQSLQDRIRSLFRLARASVEEELNGDGQPNCHTHIHNVQANGNGRHHHGHANGSSQQSGRSATASQVRAIHAIASRQQLDLAAELRNTFGVNRPDDLSISQASDLIDRIKPQPNGAGGQR